MTAAGSPGLAHRPPSHVARDETGREEHLPLPLALTRPPGADDLPDHEGHGVTQVVAGLGQAPPVPLGAGLLGPVVAVNDLLQPGGARGVGGRTEFQGGSRLTGRCAAWLRGCAWKSSTECQGAKWNENMQDLWALGCAPRPSEAQRGGCPAHGPGE